MVFHALTFARSRGIYCFNNSRGTWLTLMHWKTMFEVFNNSRGTWQTLMHWKTMFDRCYCINSTTMLKNNKNGGALFSTSSQLPCWFLHALSISIKIFVSTHGRLSWFFPTVCSIFHKFKSFLLTFSFNVACSVIFFTISKSAYLLRKLFYR